MKPRITAVEETDKGVYVWEMADGRVVGDDDGNFLSIASVKGDLAKIKKLTDAVRSYGILEGGPRFLAGRRKITDDEYEEQMWRAQNGLVPDPYDAGALRDELRANGE